MKIFCSCTTTVPDHLCGRHFDLLLFRPFEFVRYFSCSSFLSLVILFLVIFGLVILSVSYNSVVISTGSPIIPPSHLSSSSMKVLQIFSIPARNIENSSGCLSHNLTESVTPMFIFPFFVCENLVVILVVFFQLRLSQQSNNQKRVFSTQMDIKNCYVQKMHHSLLKWLLKCFHIITRVKDV